MYQILVVDDTKTERDCVKFLIDKFQLPLEISEASDGREALLLLKHKYFDILFTDIIMPFMDGLTLSKEALQLYPELKIIIFSGHDEFEYARTGLRLGINEYLLKPIVPSEFHATTEKMIAIIKEQRATGNIPQKEEFSTDNFSSRTEAVKQYIYRNYHRELSLETLAKEVYVHPDYLSRIFKLECGITINKFIKAYRMDKAKELLKGSHMKVRDICKAVGYQNYSYFCQSFREHFGVSPEKTRQSD